jgi:ABC-type Mn2+/Zn2+ transport system permease subunit
MDIFELFTLPFMQRALLGALMLSILLGLFGTFIVPRRLGFMADGISHASLLGIAFGLLVEVYPLIFAMLLAAFFGTLLARAKDYGRLTQDGLVGVFLAGGMSGAIIMMSFVPGYKPELLSYLFGNLLSIRWIEIFALILYFIITLMLFRRQWRSLIITTVHSDLSQVIGLPATTTRYFLFIGTSLTLIAGVKLLGIILVSALLIIPVLTANQIGRSFRSTFIITQLISVWASFLGIIMSYILDIPTGPAIALLLALKFLLISTISILKKKPQRD